MARLGVVVNPAANGNRGSLPGTGVLRELEAAGHDVVDLSAEAADEAQQRAHAACAAESGQLDALIVVGGDGMVHLGVNAVAGTDVPLGIVAIGSGNDFARAVGLPAHNGLDALRALERALEAGPRRVDVLRSTGAFGTIRTACVVSVGLDAAVNALANSYRFPPGGGKYIRAALTELRGFKPYGYTITIDGERREMPGTLVAVANSRYFGGGMQIAPNAQIDDGLADVVLAGALTPWQATRIFPRLYEGSHVHHPAVEIIRAKEVVVEPLAPHPQPPEAYGDGERIGAVPMRIAVEPGALQLLAPHVR
ncbi:diacylglycerol/lipid kinase family protein [Pseudactinotalea suaedae]|uniref:diacylglycerol/lipid kinase family protein n=1 Tax=Pseudactinotalea suaedae TaxID=1524924 RepID=UPI0012E254D0|nr:diacylglycerol kinase family protein [Pseudactinotalea suaedae]